jgi:hypothetical protein
LSTAPTPKRNAMSAFVHRHAESVLGALSGFDRLVLRGTLRQLCYPRGMDCYLSANRVLLKDFGAHAEHVSQQLINASLLGATQANRPVVYLPSSRPSKEDIARDIATRDGVSSGLIAVLKCVEPCLSFEVFRNRCQKRLELVSRQRKCLHLYHYFLHPTLGFMHVRIQTWFPFSVQVCLNGREWLARQMDQEAMAYQRRDNCFPWVEDLARAQELFDQQLQADWPALLGGLLGAIHPLHPALLGAMPVDYYWSVHQSEWATDLLLRSRADLERLYPKLVRYALTECPSACVMRFLGKKVRGIPSSLQQEVISDKASREEGVRVKHRVGDNSVKMYDKGSVLRIETTINEPKGFKVYRTKEGDEDGPKAWRVLRRGVADLHRRAEVSQGCNDRYQEALAAVDQPQTLAELVGEVCQRAGEVGGKAGRKVRGLNPLGEEDARLLEAVGRPEWVLDGVRNRDVARLLYGDKASGAAKRRQAARVTRLLRLLRAHGLIHKVPRTHRYQISPHGRKLITALLAARQADVVFLTDHPA